jgi:hypothetical protein
MWGYVSLRGGAPAWYTTHPGGLSLYSSTLRLFVGLEVFCSSCVGLYRVDSHWRPSSAPHCCRRIEGYSCSLENSLVTRNEGDDEIRKNLKPTLVGAGSVATEMSGEHATNASSVG